MAIPQPPQLDPIPTPDPPGLFGGWGRKLELTLLRFVLDTLNRVMSPFWHWRDIAIKNLFQSIEDEIKPVVTPLLDVIDDNTNIPQWVRGMTRHLRFSEPTTFVAIAAAIIFSCIMAMVMGLVEPLQRLFSQEIDSQLHSARMSPAEAFVALRRGAITPAEYHNQVSDGGWSERFEGVWKDILKPLVGVGDLGRLFQRGEIGEHDFTTELHKRGYDTEDTDAIKTLLQVIPGLGDIIRMAVREAFTPDVVERFQLHAELPPDMVAWAAKQGLSEDWARAYWAAHWELPPLTMGFDMLHRDIIDSDTMQMLIKTHDVSPFWRDKLIGLSYRPYTRVDVRRMFAAGVLNQEAVHKSYRDIGYDHEKATKMTEFTVAASLGTERDLTKTDVLYGYEHGFFNPTETDALLIELGYDQVEADYYRARVDYKRWQLVVKETVKYVKMQYIANQITQAEVYSQLSTAGLPNEQITRYIREWDIKKTAKSKTLTAEKLTNFRMWDIITAQEFTDEMSGLGYSARYIQWHLDFIYEKTARG